MTAILPNFDLFFNNKYTKWYYYIINHALSQVNNGYAENHHTIPTSIGGKSSLKVRLTARQHFVCHLLLRKMVINQHHRFKMTHAAACMMFYKSKHHNRAFKISSKIYETLKAEKAKTLSITRMGWNPSLETRKRMSDSQKGKKTSKETKLKLSIAGKGRNPWNSGKNLSEEHKSKIRGYKHTQEAKDRMSQHRAGKALSEEHKKAIALGNKGIKPAQSTINAVIKANKERKLTVEYRKKLSQSHIGKVWIWEPSSLKSTFVTKEIADLKIAKDGWLYGRGKLKKHLTI